jgi:hypothetical protein
MSRNRPVAGIAVALYLGLGVWMAYSLGRPRDGAGDLDALDTAFAAITALVYLGGGALLVRNVRAGRSWRMLLAPVAFVPLLLTGLILVLLALGGRL